MNAAYVRFHASGRVYRVVEQDADSALVTWFDGERRWRERFPSCEFAESSEREFERQSADPAPLRAQSRGLVIVPRPRR